MNAEELKTIVTKFYPRWSAPSNDAVENILAFLGRPTPDELRWAITRHHAANLDAATPKWEGVKAELRPQLARKHDPMSDWRCFLERNREAAPKRLAHATEREVFEAFVEAQVRPLIDAIDRANRDANAERVEHVRSMIEKVEARERRWARGVHRAAGIEPTAYLLDPAPDTRPLDQIPF